MILHDARDEEPQDSANETTSANDKDDFEHTKLISAIL
jgi:hypothetical protein